MIERCCLDESESLDVALAGGKAATLARLRAAEFEIPSFVVLSASADHDVESPDRCFPHWSQGRHLWAVRSSSIEEDGATASFAGVLESYLDVGPEALADRIRRVRQSAHAERVIRYRQQRGLTGPTPPCAVIVQSMLAPQVSGVAFGADPATDDSDICVISAIVGCAAPLVDGTEDGQMWRVDENERIFTRPDPSQDEVWLSDEQVLEVCRLTRKAGNFLGSAQDVEWAIEGGKLWLLQSRPITSRCAATSAQAGRQPVGERRVWDNANISESYGGITTPLTFSFARSVYEGVYRAFCRLMGVPQARLEANEDMFSQMLGLFRGRVYYNLFSWYRLIALLPGYASNRRFMEQMMGVREPMPDDVLAGVSQVAWRGRLKDRWQFLGSVLHLISCYRKLERMARQFVLRIDLALATPIDSFGDLRLEQLAAEYRRLERALLNRWDAPLVNDFFTMICFGLLRQLADRWAGPQGWARTGRLLGGTSGMLSVEPAKRIEAMGAMVAPIAGAADIFHRADGVQIKNLLERHPELNRLVHEYLDLFGDRCMEELKLETATLHENPSILWRSIGRSALRCRARRGAAVDDMAPSSDAVHRAAAERELFADLHRQPLRRFILGRFIRKAQRHLILRENLRFQRTRVFGRVRRIVTCMGQRLIEAGKLDQVSDVFYLEIDELLGLSEGGLGCTDLRQLAAVRKRAFDQYAHQPAPPERFETHGSALLDESFDHSSRMPDRLPGQGTGLQGIGCYPGLVRGVALRISDPFGAQPHPGQILVAERTDPGWVMLFPGAAGVLVQRGSVLSHSATLAREMRIPTIVGIKGLMEQVRDGDLIEMNGAAGTVYVVDVAPGASVPNNLCSAG